MSDNEARRDPTARQAPDRAKISPPPKLPDYPMPTRHHAKKFLGGQVSRLVVLLVVLVVTGAAGVVVYSAQFTPCNYRNPVAVQIAATLSLALAGALMNLVAHIVDRRWGNLLDGCGKLLIAAGATYAFTYGLVVALVE